MPRLRHPRRRRSPLSALLLGACLLIAPTVPPSSLVLAEEVAPECDASATVAAKANASAAEAKAQAAEARAAEVQGLLKAKEAEASELRGRLGAKDSEASELRGLLTAERGRCDGLSESAERAAAEAAAEVEALKSKAAADIREAVAEAERAARVEAERAAEAARSEIERVRREGSEAAERARRDAEASLGERLSAEVESERRRGRERLDEAEESLRRLREEAAGLLRKAESDAEAARAELEQARAESSKTEAEKARVEAELRARIEDLERGKADAERAVKEAEEATERAKRAATEGVAKANAEVDELTKQLDQARAAEMDKLSLLAEKETSWKREKRDLEWSIKKKEEEHDRFRLRKEESEKDLSYRAEKFEQGEKKLKKVVKQLKEEVKKRDEASSWCNATQITHDITFYGNMTFHALADAYIALLKAPFALAKMGYEAVEEPLAPHVMRAETLYEQHLKGPVDEHVLPVWEGKVLPASREAMDKSGEALREAKIKGGEIWDANRKLVTKHAKSAHKAATKKVEDLATRGLKYLDEIGHNTSDQEDAVVVFLQVAKQKPDELLALQAKVVGGGIFLLLLPGIVNFVFDALDVGALVITTLLVMPFWLAWKVFWFFCPLRLLFRGGGGGGGTEEEAAEPTDASEKGKEEEEEGLTDVPQSAEGGGNKSGKKKKKKKAAKEEAENGNKD